MCKCKWSIIFHFTSTFLWQILSAVAKLVKHIVHELEISFTSMRMWPTRAHLQRLKMKKITCPLPNSSSSSPECCAQHIHYHLSAIKDYFMPVVVVIFCLFVCFLISSININLQQHNRTATSCPEWAGGYNRAGCSGFKDNYRHCWLWVQLILLYWEQTTEYRLQSMYIHKGILPWPWNMGIKYLKDGFCIQSALTPSTVLHANFLENRTIDLLMEDLTIGKT